MSKYEILNGDVLERTKELDENSFDAVLCDPPYGLSFMGKNWDKGVPGKEYWKEIIRVLKPGGHLLAFGGSRTYHRLACAIEDAGFEIRDQIIYYYSSNVSQNAFLDSLSDEQQDAFLEAFGRPSMLDWIYGSGFPKSLNIGKAVDKLLGNEREVISEMPAYGIGGNGCYGGHADGATAKITKGDSDFEGWGTALKPAHEPIVLARKPLDSTVAGNVLKYGCGGLNINGCRVKAGIDHIKNCNRENVKSHWGNSDGVSKVEGSLQGRFPANLIHDGSEEVVGLFPDTKSGFMKKGTNRLMSDNPNKNTYGKWKPYKTENDTFGDSGSAARFFYCAKASKSERNAGCDDLPETKQDDSRKEGNPGGDNPRNRGVTPRKNNHPTVKPLKLIKYLSKLIQPPKRYTDRKILVPFSGSGSEMIGCLLSEWENVTGIEIEQDYINITHSRIKHWLNTIKKEEPESNPKENIEALLFK